MMFSEHSGREENGPRHASNQLIRDQCSVLGNAKVASMFSALILVTKAVLLVASVTLMSLVLFATLFLSLRGRSARKKIDAFQHFKDAFPLLRILSWHASLLLRERHGLNYEVNFSNLILGECMRKIRRGFIVEYIGSQPIFVIFRADHVEGVLNNSRNLEKGPLYDMLIPWVGHGLITSNGSLWKSRRKLLTSSFHFKILRGFLTTMNERAALFVDRIASKADNEDVSPYVDAFALDVVCETIMGVSMNCQTSDSGRQYLATVKFVGKLLVKRIVDPLSWSDFTFRKTKRGRDFYNAIKELQEFTTNIINDRKAELLSNPGKLESLAQSEESLTQSKKPFLDILLIEHLKRGSISTAGIREEVDTFMGAAHDTTSVAILWALHFIGYFPEVQRRLREEIDRYVDEDGSAVSEEQLKELTYLDMVMKECQRVRPSAPLFSRRITEEIRIERKPVPVGTEVIIYSHALHRNPEVFPKPEEFDPERFSLENSRHRSPFAYVPFSAGPRNCIGQRYATLQVKTLLVWILRRYTLKSLNHREEILAPLEIVQRPISEMRVVFSRRSTM